MRRIRDCLSFAALRDERFGWAYRAWARSAALILGLTSLAKLAGVCWDRPSLEGMEPLSGLSLKTATGLLAAAELVLAGLLLCSGTAKVGTSLTFVFAVGALGYRLWFLSPQGPCPCFGGLGHGLPVLGEIERDLSRGVLLWLVFTAWGVLVHHRLRHVA